MCYQEGDTNKVYYLPYDTRLGIFYVLDHPGYLVIGVDPTRKHPLWCDYLHLSGVDLCFATQVRLLYITKSFF